MKKEYNLKKYIYIDILAILALALIKGYIYIFESNFQHLNMMNINTIEMKSGNKENISFVVLGNIKNSLSIFQNNLIRKVNHDSPDFVVCNGNSVLDGAEDKYRILYKSLKKINSPVVVGIGENEISDNGLDRFYGHFGDTYFSFKLKDSYFIFLDTTNMSGESWQEQWLLSELQNAKGSKYIFVFMNRPAYVLQDKSILASRDKYIQDEQFRKFLIQTFSKYHITAVFASNIEGLDIRKIDNISYYTSGGAGGIITNNNNFYHYIKVNAGPDGVNYNIVKQKNISHLGVYQVFEDIWIYIHSLFYVNFLNILIFISIAILLIILVYKKVFTYKEYYRKYDEVAEIEEQKKHLNIAMFTNNYLPFIGGVPISIDRLSRGLRNLGHNVYIFAPRYPVNIEDDNYTIRCKLLMPYKKAGFEFPIVNIFSSDIEKIFDSHNFDVVHVHHPFWMGTEGLKLSKRHNIPAVLTYHTRLEQYAHYIPVFDTLFRNVISHYIIKRFSQKCNAVIAPTADAKEYLRNIGVSKSIEVLPTGVDFSKYPDEESNEVKNIKKNYKGGKEILLCSVSRLAKEKNLYFLLDGIKYIKDHTGIPFKCIIIGDGPEKENIIKTIKDQKLEDVVMLIGSKAPDEIYKYYTASDIFIFASRSETQGMVLLEAMAGKCPVVTVRSSGIENIVQDGFNGYKTKADVKEWSEKLIYIMSSSNLRQQIGENAFHFAEQYSLKSMAEKALSVYYKVIKEYIES